MSKEKSIIKEDSDIQSSLMTDMTEELMLEIKSINELVDIRKHEYDILVVKNNELLAALSTIARMSATTSVELRMKSIAKNAISIYG